MSRVGIILISCLFLLCPALGHGAAVERSIVFVENGEPIHHYSNPQSPFDGSGDQWNLFNERGQLIGTSIYDLESAEVVSSTDTQIAINVSVTYRFRNGMTVQVKDGHMIIASIDASVASAFGLPEFGDGLVSNFMDGEISSVTNAGGHVKGVEGTVSYRSRHETVGGKFFRCIDCLGILKFIM